jgi:hypothetical protein
MEKSARFELRIDTDLKRKFKKFCKDKEINLSEAVRCAITEYLGNKVFAYSLVEHLQDSTFFESFNNFYHTLPKDLRINLDELLGSEEEELVAKTPPQLLKNIKVITDRGNEALGQKNMIH